MKHSIGGQFIKTGKEIFDKLDSKVNFAIPQNLMSYLGPKGKMDDRNLEITQDNFRLQIGKMDKKNETIYTKDILLPAIEYISKKTPAEQKVIIQLRPDLAKSLSNYDQKEEANQILSFEEEKQAIIKIIKKYQKQALPKIEIVSVAKQYPDLFDLLKAQGREVLYSHNKPALNKDRLSPRLLAEYIYRVVQHNPKLMKVFYDTKTPAQKEADHKPIGQNQSDYYSVVEVGVRLYEVLSGISIQGGIDRQSKYDNIIGAILSGKNMDHFKITDFPELKELHSFCREVNPDLTFERLWIDTKGVRSVVEKKEGLSNLAYKFKIITGASAIAIAGILAGGIGGYQFSQHKEKAEITERNRDNAKKDLQDRDLKQGFHQIFTQAKDIDSKVKLLETTTNNVYYYFSKICDCGKYEDIIKGMIQSELRRGDNINTVNADVNYASQIMSHFIKDIFVPNNFEALNNLGIDLDPYKELIEQRQAFKNTININGTLTLGYNEFGRNGDGDNIVSTSGVSANIDKMIPYTYVTDRSMYPNAPRYQSNPDTLGTRLTDRDIKIKPLGSFYSPSLDEAVSVIRVTLKQDGKNIDLVLFNTSHEGGANEYILDKNLAKEFLNTWAK